MLLLWEHGLECPAAGPAPTAGRQPPDRGPRVRKKLAEGDCFLQENWG